MDYVFLNQLFLKALNPETGGLKELINPIKNAFNANDVIIYKIDDSKNYEKEYSQNISSYNLNATTCILNITKELVESNPYRTIDICFKSVKSLLFIPIVLDNTKYVIAMTKNELFEDIDDNFMKAFINTMHAILQNEERIRNLYLTSSVDPLTGLNNRGLYEKFISEKPVSDGLIYVLFDLFRLKYVNDHFSHVNGDDYIKRAANILKKYFPEKIVVKDANGKKRKLDTGDFLFRIGGDEFALVTDSKSYEEVMTIINVVLEEIKNIEFFSKNLLGINYGLAIGNDGESFRDLCVRADIELKKDKTNAYSKYNLKRRQ